MVKFSPLGTHFVVLFPKKVEVYSLTLKLLHTLNTTLRYNAVLFSQVRRGEEEVEVLCIGTEKGVVEVHQVEVGQAKVEDDQEGEEAETRPAVVTRLGTLVGHTNRSVVKWRSFSSLDSSIADHPGSNRYRR